MREFFGQKVVERNALRVLQRFPQQRQKCVLTFNFKGKCTLQSRSIVKELNINQVEFGLVEFDRSEQVKQYRLAAGYRKRTGKSKAATTTGKCYLLFSIDLSGAVLLVPWSRRISLCDLNFLEQKYQPFAASSVFSFVFLMFCLWRRT